MNNTKKAASVLILIFLLSLSSLTARAAGNYEEYGYHGNDGVIETSASSDRVIVGGMPFGIKLYTGELTVVGFSDVDAPEGAKNPAYEAGIRENDVIVKVNGKTVNDAAELIAECETKGGEIMKIECKRGTETYDFSLTPSLSVSENKYKTGMWIKDSTAGIGTVTFIVPQTGAFAGLGHCICNGKTGAIEKISKGYTTEVKVTGIDKGKKGDPGEIVGKIGEEKTGALISNTNEGVFGVFSKFPSSTYGADMMETAGKGEIEEGAAFIRCSLGEGEMNDYRVNITKSAFKDSSNRDFTVEVTDRSLLEKTGGIVQGMSGSPVIQNGKLIGAVTHVFVDDPAKGYGISISDMIDSMPDVLVKCQ